MAREQVLRGIYDALVDLDSARALEMVDTALGEELDVLEVVNQAMSPAMGEVGRRFQQGEMFLPELQLCADAYEAAMARLRPRLVEARETVPTAGTVVLGTVRGDIHTIGKNLVATMLQTAGFEVHDLGADVPPLEFVEQAERRGADIIALSALLTTTMNSQKDVIEAITQEGLRGRYRVIVGGAPVSRDWAEEIQADGYGADAIQAVELCRGLLK